MKLKADIKIREQIIVVVLVSLSMLLGMAIWSWQASHLVAVNAEKVRNEGVLLAQMAQEMRWDMLQVQQSYTDLSATRGKDGMDGGFKDAERYGQAFLDNLKKFQTHFADDAGKQKALRELASRFTSFSAQGRDMAKTYIEGGTEAGNRLMASFDTEEESLESLLIPFAKEQVELSQSMLQEVTKEALHLQNGVVWIAAMAALLIGGIGILVIYHINARLREIGKAVGSMAKGDLTQRLPLHGQRNELAQIAGNINQLGNELEHTVRVVGLHAGSVTACATELVKIRNLLLMDADSSRGVVADVTGANEQLGQEVSQVRGAVGQAMGNIQSISGSAESLSSNMTSIAAAVEQASANIATMASAAEEITANIEGVNGNLREVNKAVGSVADSIQEMTGSLRQVRERCQVASLDSERADQQAKGTHQVMEKLSLSAQEIGKVVDVINNITEQTNMLALNAAIEAAGAGDAGKGFAVVANEVKELARQTGEATRTISAQIEEIQRNTQDASAAVGEITGIVAGINQANTEILHAVDEQAVSIDTISQAMQEVESAAEEVTRNVNELNIAAQDVARAALEAASGTSEVARSAAEGATAAQEVAGSSQEALDFASTIVSSAEKTESSSRLVQGKMREASRTVQWMHGSAAHFGRMGTVLQNMSYALYASQMVLNVGMPPFNMRQVKDEHLDLQGQLEQIMHGRIGREERKLLTEQGCAFGQWAQQAGDARQAIHGHADAKRHHAEMHRLVGQFLQTVDRGDQASASALLEQYHQTRELFFKVLDGIYLGEEGMQMDARPMFQWDNRLMTGITMVDTDHKKLFDLINELHGAMKEGRGQDAVGRILHALIDYTKGHFSREEKLMTSHGYPDFAAHKPRHERLVAQLDQLGQEFMAGQFSVGIDLLTLAKSWLMEHIMKTDMKYVPFLKSKGVS